MRKILENILGNIKRNYFVNIIVTGFIIALFINPLAKLMWNLLILMSNRFSLFLVNEILKFAVRGRTSIDIFIFMFAFSTFILVNVSIIVNIKLSSRTKKKSVNKPSIPVTRLRRMAIATCFLFVGSAFLLSTYYVVYELNANHKQRMGIIAPCIDNQKEEELWSKWYLLKSKIDYINLNHELENIAESNNIELPKLFK